MAIKTGKQSGELQKVLEGLEKVSHEDMCLQPLKVNGLYKGKSKEGKDFIVAVFDGGIFGYIPTCSLDYFEDHEASDNEAYAAGNYFLHTEKKTSEKGRDYFVSWVEENK